VWGVYIKTCRIHFILAHDDKIQNLISIKVKSKFIDLLWNCVGFEVLTAVVMKSTTFWNITQCTLFKVNRSFGGTCRLHLHGRKISRARDQRERRWQAELCFHAGLLLDLFSDREDGGDIFVPNVG
jgi:hypothetical protein